MLRRAFLLSPLAAIAATATGKAETLPVKFGHRQANMAQQPGASVFEIARRIPGLSGVELQVIWKGQDLGDHASALDYKRMANRWGVEVPSIAGVWKPGGSIFRATEAEETLTRAIRSAELFGASVILVALFKPNCPDMNQESSVEPAVSLFQSMGLKAAAAGVTLGLETSLRPSDDLKFIDRIGSASVKTYYDATNTETDYPGESVPGISLLGQHIVQCHLKNGDKLLEAPGKVDWAAALKTYKRIGYNGWFVFETAHTDPDQCVDATKRNIEFALKYL